LPKFLHGSDEPRIIPHLRYARSRKRDGNLRANSPGTSAHDNHTISEKNCLLNTMRYEQHCLSGMGSEARYLLLQQHTCLGVQCAEWLVHQYHVRIRRQSTCNRGALLHATPNLVRITIFKAEEMNTTDEVASDVGSPRNV